MQVHVTFDLKDLTAEEAAKFEAKCKKLRVTSEKQTAKLLREFIEAKGGRHAGKPGSKTPRKGS